MKWLAYYQSFNGKEITTFNIFDHPGVLQDCKKAYRKFKNDRDKFFEEVQSTLMYHYWAKCEYEIILSPWMSNNKEEIEEKIDVYQQVKMNWEPFCDYVWEHRADFK